MEEEKLEILVVEDNEKHLADAREYFKGIEAKADVKVTYASTLKQAEELLKNNKFGGIISDVFFPIGEDEAENKKKIEGLQERLKGRIPDVSWDQKMAYMDAMDEWVKGNTEPPSGVYVGELALEKKIPFIYNTDTHHHGKATEPINRWTVEKGTIIVDSGSLQNETKGENKNWRQAYTAVVAMIERLDYYDMRDSLMNAPQKMKKLQQALQSAEEQGLEGFELVDEGFSSYPIHYSVERAKEKINEIQEKIVKYQPIIDKYGI